MATWFVEELRCFQSCLLGAKDPDFSLLTEATFIICLSDQGVLLIGRKEL